MLYCQLAIHIYVFLFFPLSLLILMLLSGLPGGLVVKNPPANAGDIGLKPGPERSPGEGNGNPLRYSCLENPMESSMQSNYSPWSHKELEAT